MRVIASQPFVVLVVEFHARECFSPATEQKFAISWFISAAFLSMSSLFPVDENFPVSIYAVKMALVFEP